MGFNFNILFSLFCKQKMRFFFSRNIPCAHCNSFVEFGDEQRRLHVLMGCSCMHSPIICSKCRRGHVNRRILNRLTCQWCGKEGFCKSFHEKQKLHNVSRCNFEVLSAYQKKYRSIINKTPMIRRYIEKLVSFLRVRILYVSWSPRFESQNRYSSSNPHAISIRTFILEFFRTWVQSQQFQMSRTQWKMSIFCSETILFSGFFRKLKTSTFAMLFIRKLFGSCPQTRQFRGLMMKIHAKILANFQTLFKISSVS